ncbi:TetR/AcrR family transcriptional regulator [Paeniglutamicibacter terrestris]|jgi:AcrR family transcriptional regulator|uniref:TetR family transcriptional regulator n=1 Tax=Paeniglutamicibacter terrestris TaxID=2723403 RepID=A0ABX1FZW6_9MICC|nr:TetR/AcrR family transcriptional regulator [Paeniglutamicibacter terrestris]ASN38290.1 TetR family transcriptional regulator [Arthrobacter sp. 7749]NKG19484.1 TetR family transcriptional regulator [Paeniglutamicibacter terrestris]
MANRGSYAKGIAKRAEILDVALEVFAVEGYRGTSLRKVASLCDLSLAGVMHYFDSKEDLLVQILRKRDERNEITGTTEEQTRRFIEVLTQDTAAPGLVALYVTMSAAATDPNHPAAAYFQERYARLLELAKTSYYREDKPQPSAEELEYFLAMTRISLATADGLQQQWLVDRTVDVTGTMQLLLKQIFDSMKTFSAGANHK